MQQLRSSRDKTPDRFLQCIRLHRQKATAVQSPCHNTTPAAAGAGAEGAISPRPISTSKTHWQPELCRHSTLLQFYRTAPGSTPVFPAVFLCCFSGAFTLFYSLSHRVRYVPVMATQSACLQGRRTAADDRVAVRDCRAPELRSADPHWLGRRRALARPYKPHKPRTSFSGIASHRRVSHSGSTVSSPPAPLANHHF